MRRVFERVLERGGGQYPIVWQLFIGFELGAACFARAKRVHTRAIHACPGCRSLWVAAASRESLRQCFTAGEIDALLQVMREKDLRMWCEIALAAESGTELEEAILS